MSMLISGKKAYEMMQSLPDAVILDVRESMEFVTGHIKNAKNLPLCQIANISQLIPDKSSTILVYCHSGRRSAAAFNALLQIGYTNVYDFGGIISWPYEIQR